MEILHLKDKKVYKIEVNARLYPARSGWGTPNKVTIDDIIRIKDVLYTDIKPKYAGDPTLNTSITGIALGNNDDLIKELSAKQVVPSSSFKKVYFDSECKFPRFKLSETTSIKRCLDPSKADSCIITKPSYTSQYAHNTSGKNVPYTIKLYKSKSSEEYYIFNHNQGRDDWFGNPHFYYDKGNSLKTIYNTGLSKFSGDIYEKILQFFESKGIVKSDYELYYEGPYISLYISDYEHITKLQSYMQITYDTELDKFIGTNLQKIDKESLTQINKMFRSSDATIIGMGMKLLSNYNVLDNACAIGSLIMDNFRTLQTNNAFHSVGFQQVLKSLGMDYRQLGSGDIHKVINGLYSKSTSEEDRALGREVVRQRMETELEQRMETYSKLYPDLGINVTYEIK